ncbi:MAG: hypothetical protein ACYTXC_06115 [Nostoc sp.]
MNKAAGDRFIGQPNKAQSPGQAVPLNFDSLSFDTNSLSAKNVDIKKCVRV